MIKEACLSSVKANYHDNQSQLFDYSDNEPNYTKIGVVRKPVHGIENVVDEINKELAPPMSLLEDFWEYKKERGYKHNKAWEKVDFEERYIKHLMNSELEAFESLYERIESGERVTLVCYEKQPKNCHRHVLKRLLDGCLNTLNACDYILRENLRVVE